MNTSPLTHALITGGAGFIGSHLAEALWKRGVSVTVIDTLSTGKKENIQNLIGQPGFSFVEDSVMTPGVLESSIKEDTVIFHLASAVGVRLIVEETIHSIETMILGTECVLRAATRFKNKVLLASTSEVYGKSEKLPFREGDDVVLGSTEKSRWCYAASKMLDEFLALAYHRERGLPTVVFRFFNTVGPRQSGQYGMVIPRFVEKALQGKDLTVYGDGEQSRCFCDVRDVIRAVLDLAERPEAVGQVINIGSQARITINDLARQVIDLVREEGITTASKVTHIPANEAYADGFEDIRHRMPDTAKVKSLVGWEPQIALEDTLLSVIHEKMGAGSRTSLPKRADFPLESRPSL